MKKVVILGYFIVAYNSFSYCQKSPIDTSTEDLIKIYKMTGQEYIKKKITKFSVRDLNGRKITSKILKNKITFINLWFEACVPCLAETAALNNLYEEYKHQKKFQFFSFTFETKENVERIVKKYNFKFRILLISLDSIKLINYEQGFPVSMIIDKKGKISLFTAGGPSNPKMAQEKFNIFIKPALNLKLRKKKMYN